MRYVTSIERMGMEKGIQQATLRHLQQLLQHRFESIPVDVETTLQELTGEQLELLFDAALKVNSLEEFVARITIEKGVQTGHLEGILNENSFSIPSAIAIYSSMWAGTNNDECMGVFYTLI